MESQEGLVSGMDSQQGLNVGVTVASEAPVVANGIPNGVPLNDAPVVANGIPNGVPLTDAPVIANGIPNGVPLNEAPPPVVTGVADQGRSAAAGSNLKRKRGRPRKSDIAARAAASAAEPQAQGDWGSRLVHTITAYAGEDVAAKIRSFAQRYLGLYMISVSGKVSSFTVKDPTAAGKVTYEGRYQMVSIYGSLHAPEVMEDSIHNNELRVSMINSEGIFVEGVLAGSLIAAAVVNVTVGVILPLEDKGNVPETSNPVVNCPCLALGVPCPCLNRGGHTSCNNTPPAAAENGAPGASTMDNIDL